MGILQFYNNKFVIVVFASVKIHIIHMLCDGGIYLTYVINQEF